MTKLFVIAGHGAGDSGACGGGYQEQERVRALAKRIGELGGSDVQLSDFSRDYYADNGISRLSLSTSVPIVELHMDSASSSARGGHVIIQAGIGGADDYDRALAALMAKWFPGRAQTIVERSDLANPARASARGYNYRLVENGFISNSGDLATFNAHIDDLAKGYLAAFGISVKGAEKPNSRVVQLHHPNDTVAQKWAVAQKSGEWFALGTCGYVLDVYDGKAASGTKVHGYPANGTAAQMWRFADDLGGAAYFPEGSKPVSLEPKCALGMRLTIGGTAEDAGLCIKPADKSAAQQFAVVNDGSKLCLVSVKSKYFLDLKSRGQV